MCELAFEASETTGIGDRGIDSAWSHLKSHLAKKAAWRVMEPHQSLECTTKCSGVGVGVIGDQQRGGKAFRAASLVTRGLRDLPLVLQAL